MFKELVDWVEDHAISGDFAFDCSFTNAEILNHRHGFSTKVRPHACGEQGGGV
ncbi:MAG: hypothetical protein HY710_02910 [Candidatus Latescibacteria bacterium]|nr:hypothetical protein [Candidatus Latescibacterota bacterium]